MTVEAGLIHADYRELVYVLLFNQSEKVFTVGTCDRIAQSVFFEKFVLRFEKVSTQEELGATKRGNGGFGITGITVIKKMKVPEQPEEDDLAVTAEEGIISVNDEVILHEKVDNKN